MATPILFTGPAEPARSEGVDAADDDLPGGAGRIPNVGQQPQLLTGTERVTRPQRVLGLVFGGIGGHVEVHPSSRIASAIWRQTSLRGRSSRTNDQFRIVTGPVSIAFIGFFVSDWA